MLAMFRCDELMEAAYRSFTTTLEPLREQLSKPEAPFVAYFGASVTKAYNEAIGNELRILLRCFNYCGPYARSFRSV